MSRKFQITLPVPLAQELKTTAARLRIPLAQFIRETMEDRLRALKRHSGDDPFDAVTGLVNSEERTLAARVDEVLYR